MLQKNHRFPKLVWHTTISIVKFVHVSVRSSASAMFVENNCYIPNIKCLIRRDIYSFTTRLKTSSNMVISDIENC